MNESCAPCNDGDTALEYHDHEPRSTNLHQFPRRVGIVINLDHLRDLMREFIDEQKEDYPEQRETELAFEVFLQWLRKRQETANGK